MMTPGDRLELEENLEKRRLEEDSKITSDLIQSTDGFGSAVHIRTSWGSGEL